MTRTPDAPAAADHRGGGAALTHSSLHGATVLEGFAGPGGFSEGARMLGIDDALGVELNPHACATARAAGHRRLQADIRSIDPCQLVRVKGWISGPPCPPYSTAGKRTGIADYDHVLNGIRELGENGDPGLTAQRVYRTLSEQVTDPRSALVLETLRFALNLPNVEWIIAEQVPGVLGIWAEIASELAFNDWQFCTVLFLRYSDFGVPTRRERVFLVACRDYVPDLSAIPMRDQWSSGRFGEPPTWDLVPEAAQFAAISTAQALGWPERIEVNTRGNRTTPGGNVFSADLPCPSMTGSGLRSWYRTDLGKPHGLLTPGEAGLLQGFPIDYPWQGKRSHQCQQVADSVSPLVAAALIGAVTGIPWQDTVRQRHVDQYGATADLAPAA